MPHGQAGCACGSGNPYHACCGLWHVGEPAPTAEQLMRSRYCAYTLGLINYLVSTTLPAQQAMLDTQAMALWSQSSQWLGLSIDRSLGGEPGSSRAQVTFTARWADPDGSQHSHQECSEFQKLGDRWFFIDPNHRLKAGRNEPCPCGSGRKFKQCCSG